MTNKNTSNTSFGDRCKFIWQAIQDQISSFSRQELNRFVGVCEGVLSDDIINVAEAKFIISWIENRPKIAYENGPNLISARLKQAISGGSISEEDSYELKALISEFCDGVINDDFLANTKLTTKDPKRVEIEKFKEHYKNHSRKNQSQNLYSKKSYRTALKEDQWEGEYLDEFPGITEKDHLKICYMDTSGKTSERKIVVKKVYQKNGKKYIDAYCLRRQAHRTFLASGVITCVNIDTGECL